MLVCTGQCTLIFSACPQICLQSIFVYFLGLFSVCHFCTVLYCLPAMVNKDEYITLTTRAWQVSPDIHSSTAKRRNQSDSAVNDVGWCAAWIKMGEYYVNGYSGRRQPHSAAEMFSNAAYRGDSQVCHCRSPALYTHTHTHTHTRRTSERRTEGALQPVNLMCIQQVFTV